MRDWIVKLGEFLKLSAHELLDHAGKITAEQARAKAELEYDDTPGRHNLMADFNRPQTRRSQKRALRAARRAAPIEEKLRELVRLQQLHLAIVQTRRPPHPWEKPWNILSDVREAVVIGADSVTQARVTSPFSSTISG